VAEKIEKLDEEMKEQFGGSRLSKFLFLVSWIFLICLVLSFFWRIVEYDPQNKTIVSSRWAWESTVACAIAWLCTSYLAYRLAGGRRKVQSLQRQDGNEVSLGKLSTFEKKQDSHSPGGSQNKGI